MFFYAFTVTFICYISVALLYDVYRKRKLRNTEIQKPEYPERTYRIVPNDKGKFDVEEYIINPYSIDKTSYIWFFANTYGMKDSLGRRRKNHAFNVTLDEAKEYIRKQQIADAERIAEIEAHQKHIVDNEPQIFVPSPLTKER